jgi:glucose dehydrogenase
MRRVRSLAAAFVTFLAVVMVGTPAAPASAVVPAGDWPQFMAGPYHQGWNRVESQITPTSAPALRPAWAQRIDPGPIGPGSPSIVGSTVVVGGGAVTAFDLATGDLLWSTKLKGVIATAPAWAGKTIVVTETQDTGSGGTFAGVAALDAATGAVKWEHEISSAGYSSPSVIDNSVLVSYDSGVARLRLSDGRLVWAASLGGLPGPVSSPTSDGKRVYVTDSEFTEVTALDIHRGVPVWRQLIAPGGGGTIEGFPPALIDGVLYAPLVNSGVVAFDAATGTELWHTQIGETFWWGLCTDGTHVIGVSNRTHVVALSAATGEQLWTHDLTGDSRAAALAGGVALFADQSATGASQVELFDIATGTALGTIALPSLGSPLPVAVSNGHVAVAIWDQLVVLTLPPAQLQR